MVLAEKPQSLRWCSGTGGATRYGNDKNSMKPRLTSRTSQILTSPWKTRQSLQPVNTMHDEYIRRLLRWWMKLCDIVFNHAMNCAATNPQKSRVLYVSALIVNTDVTNIITRVTSSIRFDFQTGDLSTLSSFSAARRFKVR